MQLQKCNKHDEKRDTEGTKSDKNILAMSDKKHLEPRQVSVTLPNRLLSDLLMVPHPQ